MHIELTTPALLFPAISLLLLAYTNRFLALAALIRQLHGRYKEAKDSLVFGQLTNLRRRVALVRLMQELGTLSLLGCVASMFLLFANTPVWGTRVFGFSLVMLLLSLAVSVVEIHMSVSALRLQLADCDELKPRNPLQGLGRS